MEDTLVKEGNDICDKIEALLVFDKKIIILKSILYCKYCLKFDKNEINYYTYDNFYERCEKYLEESKKYLEA